MIIEGLFKALFHDPSSQWWTCPDSVEVKMSREGIGGKLKNRDLVVGLKLHHGDDPFVDNLSRITCIDPQLEKIRMIFLFHPRIDIRRFSLPFSLPL